MEGGWEVEPECQRLREFSEKFVYQVVERWWFSSKNLVDTNYETFQFIVFFCLEFSSKLGSIHCLIGR